MEPAWTKNISSETVCNFFYAFFVIYAVFAALTLTGTIGVLSLLKLPKGLMVAQGLYGLLMFGLAATAALFHYLICDRALLSSGVGSKGGVRPAPESNPNMVAY